MIIGLLGCLPGAVIAETAYVIDRLLMGVYKDKTQTGAALEVLPTGASVEVLSRDEKLAQVRTADGITGWVDANYLMPGKPAQLLLLEVEAAHRQTAIRLREAEDRLRALTGEDSASPAKGYEAFPEPPSPVPLSRWPTLTVGQWVLLIFAFLLVFGLGGGIVGGGIRYRYYLVARPPSRHA